MSRLPSHPFLSSSPETEESNFIHNKEPLFEKPLTPSDVGKLNRLVIPKQYAERYFPIDQQQAEAGETSTLLSFEDESAVGKCWKFRYSYWNSSQSYVLTKGWSRFVKEKQLDAGDVVLFERGVNDQRDRLFIRWRKRGNVVNNNRDDFDNSNYNNDANQHYIQRGGAAAAQPYLEDGGDGGQGSGGDGGGSSKRQLRLFGVNMEWSPENDDIDHQPSSSATAADPISTTTTSSASAS